MSLYSLELYVTPLNKNGEWGKRVKKTKVAGFASKKAARDGIKVHAKHLCKLTKQNTTTFFVEAFILCKEKYVDCDVFRIRFNKETDSLELIA